MCMVAVRVCHLTGSVTVSLALHICEQHDTWKTQCKCIVLNQKNVFYRGVLNQSFIHASADLQCCSCATLKW
jgi:hypothetical protein